MCMGQTDRDNYKKCMMKLCWVHKGDRRKDYMLKIHMDNFDSEKSTKCDEQTENSSKRRYSRKRIRGKRDSSAHLPSAREQKSKKYQHKRLRMPKDV